MKIPIALIARTLACYPADFLTDTFTIAAKGEGEDPALVSKSIMDWMGLTRGEWEGMSSSKKYKKLMEHLPTAKYHSFYE